MIQTENGVLPIHQRPGYEVEANGGLAHIRVNLIGITPLLFNAMSEATLLGLRDKSNKKRSTAAKPPLREEADGKVHRNKAGDPIIPLRMMMSNLIAAGQFIKLDGKRQLSTQNETILPGMLSVVSTEIRLLDSNGNPAASEVDIQQGTNPNGGEAVCIVRPRFDDWRFEIEFEVDQNQLSQQIARDLFDKAGVWCGLGDFRPRNKGTFGKYKVQKWEQI